jgi:argininosuccinate synthase
MGAIVGLTLEFARLAAGNDSVRLQLYKGNIMLASRESPNNLYDAGIASMEGGGSYNQTDAEGFLRIQSLPLRVQGRVTPREF